jgi:virginiamycin B lyase
MSPSLVALLALQLNAGLASGRVVDPIGRVVAGVLVAAWPEGGSLRHGTLTDAAGRFSFPIGPGPHRVAIADRRFEEAGEPVSPAASVTLVARAASSPLAPSSHWLANLPDGAEKRWFILDCTGCHQFNETRAFRNGEPRSAEHWTSDITRMLANFGPRSGFPIISGQGEPAALAKWVAGNAGTGPAAPLAASASGPSAPYLVTEFDLPGPDLPHDVAVDSSGQVLITGMFTHRIVRLDPSSGATELTPIPVQGANPRALELDALGNWWALLGGPGLVARYDPGAKDWKTASISMYGHSIALGPDGAAWANDHFARDSIRLARVRLVGDKLESEEFRGALPRGGARGPSPIPYELRVGANGIVWTSLLHGNALVSFDPARRRFETYPMPDPDAGPRRFDIDGSGALWIPGYSSATLYRLDPATRRFDRFPLPDPNGLPYVARVDRRTGWVWVGTGAPDLVYRFDPVTKAYTGFPVLTRGATMRHLAIDPRNGDVWIAYGASPAIHPTRVARLRVR